MQYTLVLSNNVAICAYDFVRKWNANPACRAVARAGVDDSTKSLYEPGAPRILLPFLDVSAVDVSPQVFYALIQLTLRKQQERQPLEIIELKKPLGGRVLVIKRAEEPQPVR